MLGAELAVARREQRSMDEESFSYKLIAADKASDNESVSASERLQVTLRSLAIGRHIFNKKLSYRKQTAHQLQRQSDQRKNIQNSGWSLRDVDGPS